MKNSGHCILPRVDDPPVKNKSTKFKLNACPGVQYGTDFSGMTFEGLIFICYKLDVHASCFDLICRGVLVKTPGRSLHLSVLVALENFELQLPPQQKSSCTRSSAVTARLFSSEERRPRIEISRFSLQRWKLVKSKVTSTAKIKASTPPIDLA